MEAVEKGLTDCLNKYSIISREASNKVGGGRGGWADYPRGKGRKYKFLAEGGLKRMSRCNMETAIYSKKLGSRISEEDKGNICPELG